MIIFKDIFSGDEMISDAFDMTLTDDVVYEVDCKFITVKKGADVDIGANASTEEAAEALEDGQEIVNDVVHSFRLSQTGFDKKSYMTALREYVKRVKGRLTQDGASPEEIKAFESGVTKFVKSRLTSKSFEKPDWEFFIGESMDIEGMIVLLNYRKEGDDEIPYMVFWKHGLKEEKV